MSKPLCMALFGTGFWARYQLAAWRELPGVECVALYNRTLSKASALAHDLAPQARVYSCPEQLLASETIDFVDIVSEVGTHAPFARLASAKGIAAICQKPMAATLAEAEGMVRYAREKQTRLFIHENWRWQTPFREVKRLMDSGVIGTVFRGQIDMISGFDVYVNQPFLKELDQFILTDLGSHTLDLARYLFGEARTLYCRTARTLPNIKGENVSTHLLEMGPQAIPVGLRMAYAVNPIERECFPQTLLFIEGREGTIELDEHRVIRLTTRQGTQLHKVPLPFYSWVDHRYAVVHTSIVPCHANLLAALQGGPEAETTAEDNLQTMRLVFASYTSAATGQVISFQPS